MAPSTILLARASLHSPIFVLCELGEKNLSDNLGILQGWNTSDEQMTEWQNHGTCQGIYNAAKTRELEIIANRDPSLPA